MPEPLPFPDQLRQQLLGLTAQYNQYAQGGWDLLEILTFCFSAIDHFAEIGTTFVGLDATAQRDAVIWGLREVYLSRHIDIPLLPPVFEQMVVNMLFGEILPTLYDVLVTAKLTRHPERRTPA